MLIEMFLILLGLFLGYLGGLTEDYIFIATGICFSLFGLYLLQLNIKYKEKKIKKLKDKNKKCRIPIKKRITKRIKKKKKNI